MNTLDPMIISKACFEAALAHSSNSFLDQAKGWRSYPKLTTQWDSFNARTESIQKGIKERINLLSEVRKAIKDWPLGYKYKKSESGDLHLEKELESYLTTGIIIEKINHVGLGKAFTLRVSVTDKLTCDRNFYWNDDLFSVFNVTQSDRPCYTYAVRFELQEVLVSMMQLCEEVLPVIEESIRFHFLSNIKDRAKLIKIRERFSAKSGYKEAYSEAINWAADCELSGISLRPYLDLRNYFGVSIGPDGYLKESAYWSYRFYSPNKEKSVLFVNVPTVGRIRHKEHKYGHIRVTPDPSVEWVNTINEPYIDSVEAIYSTENSGGKRFRENGNIFDIIMELEHHKGRLCWVVHYLIVKNNERCDYDAVIDGISGEYLAEHPWELRNKI